MVGAIMKARILVVDDDAALARIVCGRLVYDGFSSDTFAISPEYYGALSRRR